MNRKQKNLIICLLLFSYIILYRVLVYKHFLAINEAISASFMIILAFISYMFYGYRKIIFNDLNRSILKKNCFGIIFYFVLLYSVGLVRGFLTNSYALTFTGIIKNVFPVVVTILSCELFRYIFIRANKDRKKSYIIITLLLALLEINMQIRYDTLISIEQIFKFITMSVLPITMKHIMCSYFVYQNDYRSCLIYRLILDTYFYYVPIEPDLSDYLVSLFNLLLPFLIFIFNLDFVDNEEYKNVNSRKKFGISDIVCTCLVVFVVLMLLGIGPFRIVGIKTPSMTPNINVGDAVIIDKTFNANKAKVNDIIGYLNDDGVVVVHRIININNDGTFITKGDYNNTADPLYVKKEQVVGKVIVKVPYIAYPAMIFRGEK